jgi:SAM-dependent methyltransferase
MTDLAEFSEAYALHRAAEGRGHGIGEMLQLPYLRSGPLRRQWAIRARTYDAFCEQLLTPLRNLLRRPLDLLDLGAGNGWLSFRAARAGHRATALDIRADSVDGLGAAALLAERSEGRMRCIHASFETIPTPSQWVDIALFNASLHYATDLAQVLTEATRVIRPHGCLAILDSPFYRHETDGAAMVAEKRRLAPGQFGERAVTLMGIDFVEFLTRARLEQASENLGLEWRRIRVRYPIGYELRPLIARLRRRRAPSRFDLWIGERR